MLNRPTKLKMDSSASMHRSTRKKVQLSRLRSQSTTNTLREFAEQVSKCCRDGWVVLDPDVGVWRVEVVGSKVLKLLLQLQGIVDLNE